MVGGGAGMLMTPQPLMDTLKSIREKSIEIFSSSMARFNILSVK
jgi:tRNA G37 N-methylase TrmD